jgi:hypothetical protein
MFHVVLAYGAQRVVGHAAEYFRLDLERRTITFAGAYENGIIDHTIGVNGLTSISVYSGNAIIRIIN